MHRFTFAGRDALKTENWYAALVIALTVPDICAALENPGRGSNNKRYVRWCEKWLVPRFTMPLGNQAAVSRLSAEDCYQLRCSLLHAGQTTISPKKRKNLHEVVFFDPTTHAHLGQGQEFMDGKMISSHLQVRVDLFCSEMYRAADEWDLWAKDNEAIQLEKTKLLTIHPPGTRINAGVYK